MKSMSLKYLKITSPDVNNGTGCRVTLWIPGCTHKCPFCHNSWTADYNIGKPLDDTAKSLIFNILSKPYIAGLTISGGDPLDQSDVVLHELSKFLSDVKNKFPEKNIWMYTGYYYNDLKTNQLNVLKYCDVLVDGPFIKDLADPSLPFRGSSNQSIIYLTNLKKT